MTDPLDRKLRQTDFGHYRGVLQRSLDAFHEEEQERLQLTPAQLAEKKTEAAKELEEQSKASPAARGLYGDPSAMVNKRSRTKRKTKEN